MPSIATRPGRPMIEEPTSRRPEFSAGLRVRLADGREWSLAPLPEPGTDPEFEELLHGIAEAEDSADRLRLELALTIEGLRRNYYMGSDELTALLSFRRGDPGLAELQAAVRGLTDRALFARRALAVGTT